MLEKVVDVAQIEGLVRRSDLKHVADREADTREERAGVLDVLGAEVEAGVVHKPRQAVGVEEAVVVGRAAGGFEDRERLLDWEFHLQRFVPELAKTLQAWV